MSDQGNWISLQRAVAAIHEVMAGAPGPVYQTLVNLCADGLVRARWTEHASKTQPAIPRRVWIGASIDWSSPSGRVDKADGNGMAGVDFSEEDLRAWAAAAALGPAAPEQPDVAHPQTTSRQTAEEAAESLIAAWLQEEPCLTRAVISTKAHQTIRDLQPKEFDRAWRRVPRELKKGPGRPKNPLGNPPI
jgi:hypothetical protein